MANKLKNKKFGILGLGISNKPVLEFFINHEYDFIVWDDNQKSRDNISKEIKQKYGINLYDFFIEPNKQKWKNIDYLIMSPGIPLSHPKPHAIVELIKQDKVKIICDIELFYLLYPNNQYIGITGTNGKSTITALTYHIINNITDNAIIAGNIGKPIFSMAPLENKIIVLEISSYQIDLLDTIRFSLSALSNITPDHIDRHGSFTNYINIKYQLLSRLNHKTSIINIDSDVTESLYSKLQSSKHNVIPTSTKTELHNGISIKNNIIQDNIAHSSIHIPNNNYLIGKHNAQNIVIAYTIAFEIKKIPEPHLSKIIKSFEGLKHRMQFVGKYKNITFINDSKGTNAVSTLQALKSCKNTYWILGGIAKEDGIDPLIPTLGNVKCAFTIGQAKDIFAKTLREHKTPCYIKDNLYEAFAEATKKALHDKDDVVILLSPACSSFDQWQNFEERGEAFIKLTKDFINNQEQ